MKRNRKQNLKFLIVVLVLLLSIGFAALNATLKIDGTVNVAKSTWDVHFENVSITEGSVTANPAPTTNNTDTTEMAYTINFTKPGDYFEFTVDVVNDGTMDAMVDIVSNKAYNSTGTTEIQLPNYLTNSVTYVDGVEIDSNQLLEKDTSEKIKVRVEFKKDISVSDLPSSGDTTVMFKFIGSYKQADETAVYRSSKPKRIAPAATDTHKGIVYLNPTNLSTSCDASSSVSTTGTKTGCMKFYIFDDSGDTYKMILDHNTTATVAWASHADYIEAGGTESDWEDGYYNIKGPVTALKQLNIDTAGWVGSPRLITAYEIANIVNYSSFDGSYNSYFSFEDVTPGVHYDENTVSPFAWLYDYTYECTNNGCTIADESTSGYWTSTATTDSSFDSFASTEMGELYNYANTDYDTGYGIRPVITLSKSQILD